MSEASISQVRSFNRLVAERVGAVGEDFLGRKRTLGESRLLWEIGPEGIDVRVVDPRDAAAQWCLARYYAELDERFEGGFELSRAISTEPDELMLPAGLIVVAWLHGDPVGCGVLKLHGRAPAELKRMWV